MSIRLVGVALVVALGGCSAAAPTPQRQPTAPVVIVTQPASPPKPKATTKATATTRPTQQGVHPGAFCKPAGALGMTVNGVRMRCTTSPTDARNRWRMA